MGKSRMDLQDLLQGLIGIRSDGKSNVYFQPPESIKLNYPCIIFNRIDGDTKYADNMPHTFTKKYEITLITKDPDSDLVDRLAMAFPTIRYNRFFISDNLNHDVFVLYY